MGPDAVARACGREDFAPLETEFLADDEAAYASLDGFLLIGSEDWTERRQSLLENPIAARPRPILVGNPDIVAPRSDDFSLEPGYYAHRLEDATGRRPEFFGKPFCDISTLALSRLSHVPAPGKVLVVGDTLHTDVLGGGTMGFSTALMTDYGSLAGIDVRSAIEEAGIIPDFVVARP